MITDIIIPQYLTTDLTIRCLEALQANTRDFRVILVDDGTPDRAAVDKVVEVLRLVDPKHVFLRSDENRGYGPTVCAGMNAVESSIFVLMNNDVRVTPDWLPKIIAGITIHARVAMLAPVADDMSGVCGYKSMAERLGYCAERDGTPEEFFGSLSTDILMIDRIGSEDDVVPGFCTAMRRDVVIDHLGGYDKRFLLVRGDSDLNRRIHALGYLTGVCVNCFVYHDLCATRKVMDRKVLNRRRLADYALYERKNRERVA